MNNDSTRRRLTGPRRIVSALLLNYFGTKHTKTMPSTDHLADMKSICLNNKYMTHKLINYLQNNTNAIEKYKYLINRVKILHTCWEMGGCLAWNIFRYISTKLADKVYILFFYIYIKFHAKICMHCWNIKKSQRVTYLGSPCRPRCAVWELTAFETLKRQRVKSNSKRPHIGSIVSSV